ncbi:hypothetical protein HMPREF0580_0452 [Mobiluncus mulieris ATCC 35239]|uniref:Uncharacterized protein n=1 Tax=Mobiluncus mulieris ATCC 35239 TaxID=871571 RepID=E0QNI8_9ACTO|nr:hypothetical protein HMPREF0580_0452 [Mobiluncus mulieris ATCC 35239]
MTGNPEPRGYLPTAPNKFENTTPRMCKEITDFFTHPGNV